MRTVARALALSCVVLCAVPLLADEPAPAAPPPPAATTPPDAPARLLPDRGQVRRLSLDEAVRMALKANLPLLAGTLDAPIAMEGYRAAQAVFDPLATAGAEYAHAETPVTSAFFGREVLSDEQLGVEAGVSQLLTTGGTASLLYEADRLDTDSLFVTLNPSWTQRFTLEGAQPLLRGAGDVVMTDIRRASNGVRIAQEGQRALVEDILLSVVVAYWELAYAQAEVQARRKSEQVAGELLHDAEARLAARVGTPLDVASASAGLERRRGDRITAEGAQGAAQDVLRMLVLPFTRCADPGVVFVATDDPRAGRGMSPRPEEMERYVQTALANRPELKGSTAGLRNRDLDVYESADAVRPQLDLVGRVATSGLETGFGGSLEDTIGAEALTAGLGLQFSMFIGQRAAKANLRLAEWARRQAVIQHRELENQVIAEVRSALRDVVTARAREQAGREEVRAGEEDLRGERQLLDNGKSTPFRVLQKENDLTDARTRLDRSTADRKIAEARVWRAIGFLGRTLGVGAGSP